MITEQPGEPAQEDLRTRIARLRALMGYLNDLLLIPMFTVIILETSTRFQQQESLELFRVTNLGFCLSFFIEWVLALYLSRSKKAFLTSGNEILNLISCIPFGILFQGARLFRLVRIIRVFRLAIRARRYRGRGRQLLQMISLVGSTVLAGALALRIVEPESTHHQHFIDALWWSIVTVSTVGYGDITPETSAGRLVASALIMFGVGVVGYTAGFMSSILDAEEHEREQAAQARLEANMLRIMDHLNIAPISDDELAALRERELP